MTQPRVRQGLVLGMSTLAFTVCFMVWMMFAVLGVPIKELLQLNETQFGLLAATPVLTGSLARLPLGLLTDRFGGRSVFLVLMLTCVAPLYLISHATAYWQFLVLGLFVGLAGGSFSVGIAYVAKWFDKENQGFAMGIFGAGNAGAAVTKFLAPALIAAGSWQLVPKVFSAILFVTALLFWFLSAENKDHRSATGASLREQLSALKDPAVWRYCQYYSIVFGGYVALALWMTQYYVREYGFSLQSAALLAACFSLPGGVLRAVGGWMSDRWGAQSVTWWVLWVSWICLFLLSYPQTQLQVQSINGPVSFHIGLTPTLFTVLLFVMGIAFAFGKASVFKYIANDYPQNMGAVSGIVGLAGGLGGFVLPILFGALVDLTGVRSSCFMLMYGVVWVSLTWMYFSEIRKRPLLGKQPPATSSPFSSIAQGEEHVRSAKA
ncbi:MULTISPECIES: MFS transporter [Pseudomonas]|uniref:NarK/NasA family nitrate transporter n=4 Tax=Pseudomonas TaxID=286 RepID=A0A0R2YB31_9PSED|nr:MULTISPECIES: nitrate/nitrite transporter [Pseudomonas]AKA85971.1 Nitrate/nitrite transporter [Pseudomonas synxantha]AMS21385.1 MFS transporter [Pseudomonas synxantha]AZE60548.1 Nitrate/nitrite transporter NarK [Pseudomonas synxantha]AZE66506.1 Nitrate/nitrite transporter NarK [Pseudomonas synxantha]AZE77989.1 Nitrate/nitrite transporter NarK [Pseudomonas synxantha]